MINILAIADDNEHMFLLDELVTDFDMFMRDCDDQEFRTLGLMPSYTDIDIRHPETGDTKLLDSLEIFLDASRNKNLYISTSNEDVLLFFRIAILNKRLCASELKLYFTTGEIGNYELREISFDEKAEYKESPPVFELRTKLLLDLLKLKGQNDQTCSNI